MRLLLINTDIFYGLPIGTKTVISNDLNRVMVVILRYSTEFSSFGNQLCESV